LSAIFAHETGQAEAAQRLGRAAAAKPEYVTLLPLLEPVLSR
jgi:hypothetical protein